MKFSNIILSGIAASFLMACNQPEKQQAEEPKKDSTEFVWQTEQFADIKIIRYQIPGWDKLSAQQKELVYYLTEAGYAGRDIIWDQNYRHNLSIRRALENIAANYKGDKNTADWNKLMEYSKRVWFSNGIHHHYSNTKIKPEFSEAYFDQLLSETGTQLNAEAKAVIFNDEDLKKVNLDPEKDLVAGSAVNFYEPGITEKEVDAYYSKIIKKGEKQPIEYGHNSKLVRGKNGLEEKVWKLGGMYSEAIEKVIYWLEKAVGVAENQKQADALKILIDFYKTGDLKTWDAYNIAWSQATEGDIDYINSFIEVYHDPKGFKGTYESIVQIKDFDASERMAKLEQNVQWFEDNSPILDQHKKKNVTGVTYKVVNVAGESGDASPSTPIGVNLPNNNWIRATHGSKSVSLGNIVEAYSMAGGKGILAEFCLTEEELKRSEEHGKLSDKLHTALHEVVGHASGQIEEGIGVPSETLKNYANALEEGRADLVALYYLLDPKLVELGLIPSLEVGKAEYDSYIRNGLMLQLRRLKVGEVIEEAHMRNRQMIAKWAYEMGKKDNVIEKVTKDGKTYFRINDYEKLRVLFGELLKEIQRIKSQGDYKAGRDLVENYGVQVDADIHKEVLARTEKLNIAPYGGFINPRLVPVMQGDKIVDVKVEYPADFTEQMLEYGKKYSFLPDYN